MPKVVRHQDLEVYRRAFDVPQEIFDLSKKFPKEEMYSLTDQIRRSSRSVCANLAEAWRKRRYKAAFIAKLCDCEAEAAETQTWLEFGVKCGYIPRETAAALFKIYESNISTFVGMINHSETWVLPSGRK